MTLDMADDSLQTAKTFKASAIAHPSQALIKYQGMRDERLRLPFHDSVSVCVAPLYTHTTVEFSPHLAEDIVEVDQKKLTGRELERAVDVVDRTRQLAITALRFRAVSTNSFPSSVGLGASSSGFAALAKAAVDALRLKISMEELSRVARLGAGSAARSVAGGFSYWRAGCSDETSYAYQLEHETHVRLGIVVVLVEHYKQTEVAHREALTSPLYRARLSYIGKALVQMRQAIREADVETIGWLAEYDTLNVHAIVMSGEHGTVFWHPETLQVMLKVRAMRSSGLPVYFSTNTGAALFLNTHQDLVNDVQDRLQALGYRTQIGYPGGAVRGCSEHLF